MVSAYVFISKAQRDIIAADGLPEDRLFVKPNLVPAQITSSVTTEPRMVYAGRLTEAKGIPLLMEAWSRHAQWGKRRSLGALRRRRRTP